MVQVEKNLYLFVNVARKTELGISGFGISVTTMEEVFIKVGEGTDETLDQRYILGFIVVSIVICLTTCLIFCGIMQQIIHDPSVIMFVLLESSAVVLAVIFLFHILSLTPPDKLLLLKMVTHMHQLLLY